MPPQKQQAEKEKELEALQNNADGPPKVEICPPSPGADGKPRQGTHESPLIHDAVQLQVSYADHMIDMYYLTLQ